MPTEVNPFLTEISEPLFPKGAWGRDMTFHEMVMMEGLEGLWREGHTEAEDKCFGQDILEEVALGQGILRDILDEQGLPYTKEAIAHITDSRDYNALGDLNETIEGAAAPLSMLLSAIKEEPVLPERDNCRIIESLLARRQAFKQEAGERRPELELAKQQFAERMHYAIDHEGLPLTHEQLDTRLGVTSLFFADCFALGFGTTGQCLSTDETEIIHVAISQTGENLTKTTYHELLHAISGSAVKRSGLRVAPGKNGLWSNEAMTDTLAVLLLDEEAIGYRFDSSKHSLWQGEADETIYRHIKRNTDAFVQSYGSYKEAFIAFSSRLPSKVVADIYFKRDGDALEPDQRAGTHAAREFQRAIKRLGGPGRIAVMREINQLFVAASDIADDPKKPLQYGEDEEQKARGIAYTVRQEDWQSGWRSILERRRHQRETEKYTKSYQKRISRAQKAARSEHKK